MKRIILILFIFSLFSANVYSQGTWTWTWGVQGNINQVNNGVGNFSPTNNPTGRYAAACWTDNDGKFWRYGGQRFSDLWQYNPAINQWALMNGVTTISTPVNHGTQGVASVTNTPGEDVFGHPAWTDLQGNLWLYSALQTDDVWKFDVTSNMWAWMNGTQTFGAPAVYGVQGVSGPTVSPGMINETDCKWTDNAGNLWLFNELDGVLWKYDLTINQWTWVRGNPGNSVVYGALGVSAPNNQPGTFSACPSVGALYCMWNDAQNNLWMIVNRSGATLDAEIWKYSIALNEWTCTRRDVSSFGAIQANYGIQCVESSTAFPIPRTENRARWVDDCDNLWIYGGIGYCLQGADMNDLWRYSPTTNNWTWVRGTTTATVFGTQGIANVLNQPVSGFGQDHWQNQQGFWLQGGANFNGAETHHMWLYQPDTVIANFAYASTSCLQYNFTDQSTSGCNNIKSYSWDFGDPANGITNTDTVANPSHVFSGSGTYQVTLIVENCTWNADTIVQIISVNCGLNIVLTPDAVCLGDCINLYAPTTSGVYPYTYQWDNGIADTDSIADNICPNITTTYTVIVTDAIGAMDTATAIIIVTNPPMVNLGNDTTICGITSSVLDAQNSGATYVWQDGSVNQTFSTNQSGMYWVTVSNANCSISDTINLSFIGLSLNLGNDTALCAGQQLVLNAQNPGATYVWQDGSVNQTFSTSQPGMYWVTVSNANCSTSDTINLSFISLSLNLGYDTTICGITSSVLDAQNPGATYVWQDGSVNQTFSTNQSGMYWVTVSNANCSISDTINLSFIGLSLNLGNDTALCVGQQLVLNAQNSGAAYLWQDGNVNQVFVATQTGTYWVNTTVATCSVNDTIVVSFSQPFANFSQNDTADCPPLNVAFSDSSTAIGGISSWQWDFGDGNTSTIQHPNHHFANSGTYDVTLNVTDNNDCTKDTTKIVSVTVFPIPAADFSFSPNMIDLSNPVVQFSDNSIGATSWLWDFGDGSISTEQNPTNVYESVGTYIITLTVTNQYGCSSIISYTLIVETPFNIYLPNTFTPDGDGVNDVFKAKGEGIKEFNLMIFDRWGELLFESKNINLGWNGSFKGEEMPLGTYVWKLKVKSLKNEGHYFVGHINLIK